MNARIRPEQPGDEAAIHQVHRAAFGGTVEADLVDKLRLAQGLFVSIVAIERNEIVGHILFTEVEIPGGSVAAGLAPMSVLPPYQRRGIGSQLVRAGLDACRREGYDLVVVVGHPEYYPRFGFVPAHAHGLEFSAEIPQEAFMVLELEPGAASGVGGKVKYRPEFSSA